MGTLAVLRAHSFRQRDSFWLRCYLRLPLPPLAYFLMIAAYLACNEFNATNALSYWGDGQLATALDHAIPFRPWMIFAYVSNFAFYLLPKALLRGDAGRRAAYASIQRSLLLVTMISCALFLLFPSSVEMREVAFMAVDREAYPAWLLNACSALFTVDHSFNAWPSLHVSQPLLILLATHHLAVFDPVQRFCNWACFALLVWSVLVLKQHYVWDVVSGAVLALLVWRHWLCPRLAATRGRAVIGSVLGKGA